MVKPIMRDAFFLNQKSEEATKADLSVARDLEDTLMATRFQKITDHETDQQ